MKEPLCFVLTYGVALGAHDIGIDKLPQLSTIVRLMTSSAKPFVELNPFDLTITATGMFSESQIKMLTDFGFTRYDPRKHTIKDVRMWQELLEWSYFIEKCRKNTEKPVIQVLNDIKTAGTCKRY